MIITFCFMPFEYEPMSWFAAWVQAKQLEERADLSREERRRQFAEPSDQLEVLGRRLEGVEVRLFGNVAETLAELDGIARDVVAVPEHGAGRRLEQPGEHLGRGALPRSVRTEVAHHLTGANLEAHVVDGGAPKKRFTRCRASSMR